MNNKEYILIKNQDDELIKWEIQEEFVLTYEVRHQGLITRVYKDSVSMVNGELVSSEIKKTKFNNGNFGIASFGLVRLD